MTAPPDLAAAATRARTMAAALALGQRLDLWGLALFVPALIVLVAAGLCGLPWSGLASLGLVVSLLAGAAQRVCALRVAFDAALFRYWAETWEKAAAQGDDGGAPVADLAADLAALDQALAACGLRRPAGGETRGLEPRLRGAGRWLRRQTLSLTVQFAALSAALAAMV